MKVLLVISIALCGFQTVAAADNISKIFIDYGSDIDLQACPSGIADVVTTEAKSEIKRLQSLWAIYERDLLGTTVSIVGKPFLRHEETVSGVVCPSLKGEAKPILVPIWPYLNSTTRVHPFDERLFVGLTHHELLHHYVDSILGSEFPNTPMLQKYANEPPLVRRHLHVDAVQKSVFLQLGRPLEINAIIANDSASFGPEYKRAWEIVNHDGVDAFIKELRQ